MFPEHSCMSLPEIAWSLKSPNQSDVAGDPIVTFAPCQKVTQVKTSFFFVILYRCLANQNTYTKWKKNYLYSGVSQFLTGLRYYLEKVLRDRGGGISRTGPLSFDLKRSPKHLHTKIPNHYENICFLNFVQVSMPNMTGRPGGVPDNGNEWRKFCVVPRSHPLRPLVWYFVL